jgi:hypothetical protein
MLATLRLRIATLLACFLNTIHVAINFMVFFCLCEKQFLASREEEYRKKLFENGIMWRIHRSEVGGRERERAEVTGGWLVLHNEEFHNLCSSPNIIRKIKLYKRRTRYVGNTEEISNCWRKPEGKNSPDHVGVLRLLILKIKWSSDCELDSSGSVQKLMSGSCVHGYEPYNSIKVGKYFELLSDYQHLIKDSAL